MEMHHLVGVKGLETTAKMDQEERKTHLVNHRGGEKNMEGARVTIFRSHTTVSYEYYINLINF